MEHYHIPGNTVAVGIGGLGDVEVVRHTGGYVLVVVYTGLVVVLRVVVVVFLVTVRLVELTGRRLKCSTSKLDQ